MNTMNLKSYLQQKNQIKLDKHSEWPVNQEIPLSAFKLNRDVLSHEETFMALGLIYQMLTDQKVNHELRLEKVDPDHEFSWNIYMVQKRNCKSPATQEKEMTELVNLCKNICWCVQNLTPYMAGSNRSYLVGCMLYDLELELEEK